MKNVWITRAATLGLMAGMISLPLTAIASEEMTVETPKVYTPAKVNGVDGFWVEYQKKVYRKIPKIINADKVGWFDQSLQDLYADILGLDRALTPAELTALYDKYGIPKGFSTTRDYTNGLHDFKFEQVTAQLRQDLALYGKLMKAQTTDEILDALGGAGINNQINSLIADVSQRWYGGGNTTGAAYIWDANDGVHTMGYSHGGNTAVYKDQANLDATIWARNANKSVKDALLNRPDDFRHLANNVGSVSGFVHAAKFWALANSPLPLGGTVYSTALSVNGPIALGEDDASDRTRLMDTARFLYSTNWETHSPIALDLNHDGKIGVTGSSTAQRRMRGSAFVADNSVWFDIAGTGKKLNIEWLDKKSGDGFLVDDSHGRISKALTKGGELDGTFLFGDSIGYTHGYHKLAVKKVKVNVASVAQIDAGTNWSTLFKKQPVLKGDVLKTMKVWIDGNGDAKMQANELKSLASLGITELGATPVTTRNAKGEFLIQSYFVQNGQKHMTEDVWFAENPMTMEKK